MRIVTWNEKDNPDLPARQVTQDAQTGAKKFGSRLAGTLIGLQEIGEWADHLAFQRAFKKPYIQTFLSKDIPMIYNGLLFSTSEREFHLAHKGKAGRTPYRGWTQALVTFRLRRSIKPFYWINTHMLHHPFTDEWGRKHWNLHFDKMRAEIQYQNSRGYDVILTGDLNISQLPRSFTSNQRVLAHNGLDWVILCPTKVRGKGNSYTAKRSYVYYKEFHTDHAVLELILSVGVKK